MSRKKIEAPTQTGELSDALAARFAESQLPPPKSARAAALGGERPKSPATRPAPAGMTRISLYVTSDAAEALEQAVARVLAVVPMAKKADALSALLAAGAGHSETVAADLKAQILAELDS